MVAVGTVAVGMVSQATGLSGGHRKGDRPGTLV